MQEYEELRSNERRDEHKKRNQTPNEIKRPSVQGVLLANTILDLDNKS